MKNEKSHERDQLILQFGILMQPLVDLFDNKIVPDLDLYSIAIAKVQAGDNSWRQTVKAFATFAPDLFFRQEFNDISHVPERCWGELHSFMKRHNLDSELSSLKGSACDIVRSAKSKFFELIDRIPITWEPIVFEANTPFTAYLRIKETMGV